MTKPEGRDYCGFFKNISYLVWDGLGFFGYDDNKLERVRGTKPRWFDRFLNVRYVLFQVVFVAVIVYVFASQIENLDTLKQQ